jgi:hypothetical protein
MAAALCVREGLRPADLARPPYIQQLQRELLRRGQYIPSVRLDDPDNLARTARISASSVFQLSALPADGPSAQLDHSWAQMLPVLPGPMPAISFWIDVSAPTTLQVELRTSNCPENYTPDMTLETQTFDLQTGINQPITARFDVTIDAARYVFICLMKNPAVAVHTSEQRVTGVLSVCNTQNLSVSNYGAQQPTHDIGIEAFEFWTPLRRPKGQNLAVTVEPPLAVFEPSSVIIGWARPTTGPNAWVAAPADPAPTLRLEWDQPQTIRRIELSFDTDFDHPMESVLMGHPENVMPFCVKRYRLLDGIGRLVAACDDNHQTRNTICLDKPISTTCIRIELPETHGNAPAALFEVRCYSS